MLTKNILFLYLFLIPIFCMANNDSASVKNFNIGLVLSYNQPIRIGEHPPDYILNSDLIVYHKRHSLSFGVMFPYRVKKYGKDKIELSFSYLFNIKSNKRIKIYTGAGFYQRSFDFSIGDINSIWYYRSLEKNRLCMIDFAADIKILQQFWLTFNASTGINAAKYKLYEGSFSNIQIKNFRFTKFACLLSMGIIFKLYK